MNNEQFRKLMLPGASSAQSSVPNEGSRLGSRQRSGMLMTPRSLGTNVQADFARQLADRNRALHPHKKFKTSTPKGSKLAAGYTDRAIERQKQAEDDREARVKALDESYKKGEVDKETYENLRSQIAGGDLDSTHLVKGLDFRLLKRIRDGQNVYKKPESEDGSADEDGGRSDADNDMDDEFDQLEAKEVHAVEKEKAERKKGQLSTVAHTPGRKRTRDQIMAELKASREAAKAQPKSVLSSRFTKIGAKKSPGTRIERDEKGREVMIIVDEHGNEKRKVRKVRPGAEEEEDLMMPDPNAKPLGMEVPEQYRKKEDENELEEDGDVDIFDDVGDDYDPLAGLEGSDSEPDSDGEEGKDGASSSNRQGGGGKLETDMPPPPLPASAAPQYNYFKGAKTGLVSEEATSNPSMSDPAIMAAIKKAASIHPIEHDGEEDETAEMREKRRAGEERRKKLLESSNRDEQDMDMSFGTSRFEDEADFDDDGKVKLSRWGEDDDGGDGRSRGGSSKRKRGPKKRKGDGNSAADVLRVMEQRKKQS